MGEPRLTEVYVVVYDARQYETPRGVYSLIVVSTGCLSFANTLDAVSLNDNKSVERLSLVDDAAIGY